MKTYYEKLKDPRWQRKRLEIMQRDGFKCADCGEDSETLNIHHRYYIKGRNPWEYPDWSMKTLCDGCHHHRHEMEISRKEGGNLPLEDTFERIFVFFGAGDEMAEMDIWDLSVEMCMLSESIGRKEAFRMVLLLIHGLRKNMES